MKKLITILLLISFASNAQNKSIALKVSSVDTATMLTPYLRSTNFGLLKSGQTVSADTSLLATRLRVQKGIDSLGNVVVHKTGAEDIYGIKTFYNAPYIYGINLGFGSTIQWPNSTQTLGMNLLGPSYFGGGSNVYFHYAHGNTDTLAFLSDTTLLNLSTRFSYKQPQLNGTGFVKASGTTISYDNSTYLTTYSASSTYLPLAGGTLTGALGGTSATFSSTIISSAAAAIQFRNSTSLRWELDRDGTETGSNAGSDLTLYRYDDTGAYLGTFFTLTRSTGAATFNGDITATTGTTRLGITYTGAIINNLSTGGVLYFQNAGSNIAVMSNTSSLIGGGSSTDFTTYVYGSNPYNIYTNGVKRFDISSTGAATFSSSVNNLGFNVAPSSTGTGVSYLEFRNTGGDFYIGRESSTAGGFFTGSSAYADVLYGINPLQVIIGGVKRFEIATSGAATFTGEVGFNNLATFNNSATIGAAGVGGGANNKLTFNYENNAASRSWRLVTDINSFGDFQIQQSTTQTGTTYASKLYFDNTGAATFSSTLGINGVSDNVKSGTYTPTAQDFTNVTSATVYASQYIRVGNVVTVSGKIRPVATLPATVSYFTISLPFSSSFSAEEQAAGHGTLKNLQTSDVDAVIYANIYGTNVQFKYYTNLSGGADILYQFTYQIL